ncbi:MAG: S-layer homology domain-containing protein [Lachnospiraceae bacterium]|nr:S-layer homology domain-containing protein [Lachnospiraceae bacterium]
MKRKKIYQFFVSAIACVSMAVSPVQVGASAITTSETEPVVEAAADVPEVATSISSNTAATNVVGSANFSDVVKGKYYYDAIQWAATNGISSGVSSTKFGVSEVSTRAHVVTMLWRAAGSPSVTGKNPFSDVKSSDYYYSAVLWAVQQGITVGTKPDQFSPGMGCTRAHVVSFLQRAYKATLNQQAASEPFKDVSNKNYYYNSVRWALKYGITSGTTATTFSPNKSCTRADTVTFLYRAVKAAASASNAGKVTPTPTPTATPTPTVTPAAANTTEEIVRRNSTIGKDAALTDGVYRFVSVADAGFAMAVDGNSLNDRGNIEVSATRTNETTQWFNVKSLGDGIYVISNFASDRRLSVQYASQEDGGNIQQFHVTDHDAQKWYIRRLTSGKIVIVNKYSGRVIEVSGKNVAEGANCDQISETDSANAQWDAVRVKNTTRFTGWVLRDSQRYYRRNGVLLTGTQVVDGKTLHFSDKGVLYYKIYVDGYYYDENGMKASVKSPYRTTINGKKTLKTLLQNAMVPCGRTLYIWGGGWGGYNVDTAIIGVPSDSWSFFTEYADSNYDYKNYRYQYGKGLDCSGFIAWDVYNTAYTAKNQANIVYQSSTVATEYQKKGWVRLDDKKYYPGDIVSMSGHVWMCLGTYDDGSILLVHSSPNGCQISGTTGTAVERAAYYMSKYYPEWPYNVRTVGTGYTKYIHKGTWITDGTGLLTDPEGVQGMSADQVMKMLFGE